MELQHSFTVPVSAREAFAVLRDVQRIAPCMPGATVDEVDGDKFTGRVKVKLGPVQVTYRGEAEYAEVDEERFQATLVARGREARGSGTAQATVTARLEEQGDSTTVHVTTDLAITGRPAQFGRGVMADVGEKLIGQFADCLAGELARGGAGAPVSTVPGEPAAAAVAAAPAAAATGENAPVEAEGSGDPYPEGVPATPFGSTDAEGWQPAVGGPPPEGTDAGTGVGPTAAEAAETPPQGIPLSELAPPARAEPPASGAPAPEAADPAPEAAAPKVEEPAAKASVTALPPRPTDDAIDLLDVAGGAVAKRAAPAAGAIALLLLLIWLIRRRS